MFYFNITSFGCEGPYRMAVVDGVCWAEFISIRIDELVSDDGRLTSDV